MRRDECVASTRTAWGQSPPLLWGQSPLLLGDSPCCYSRTAWGQVPAATMGTVPAAIRQRRRIHAHSLGTVPAATMGTVPAAIGGQSPLLFFCPVLPAPNPVLPVPPPAGEVRSGDCPHRSVGRDEGVASTGAGNRGVPAGSRQDSSPRPVPLRHHTPRARRSRAARFPSRPQCRWHGHRP